MANRSFQEALDSGDFVVTTEVGPPKGTNIEEMLHHIDLLKDRVDAINTTDNQSSVMRISSLAVCRLAQERGAEAILQLTCRDRNRMALQSELLSANILGCIMFSVSLAIMSALETIPTPSRSSISIRCI